MRSKYTCDKKLKIYNHTLFFENNLKKAKKLYCGTNTNKKYSKVKSAIDNKIKRNMSNVMKEYKTYVNELKKEKKLDDITQVLDYPSYSYEELKEKKNKLKKMTLNLNENLIENEYFDLYDFDNIIKDVPIGLQNLSQSHTKIDYDFRIKYKEGSVSKTENESINDIYNDDKNLEEQKQQINESDKNDLNDIYAEETNNKEDSKDEYDNDYFDKDINSEELKKIEDIKNKSSIINEINQDNINKSNIKESDNFKEDDNKDNENSINKEPVESLIKDDNKEQNIEEVTDKIKDKDNKEFVSNDKQTYDQIEEKVFKKAVIQDNSLINKDINNSEQMKKDECAKKIQKNYRSHKSHKNDNKLLHKNLLYTGWDNDNEEEQKNVIMIYLVEQGEYNNILKIGTKIYSIEKMQNYINFYTIDEIISHQFYDNDNLTIPIFKQNAKEIAEKIFASFNESIAKQNILMNSDEINNNIKETDINIQESQHNNNNNNNKSHLEDSKIKDSCYSDNIVEDIISKNTNKFKFAEID